MITALPHSPECEQVVLGCCILSPELVDQVAACNLDVFYLPSHRSIWAQLQHIRKEKKDFDCETFLEFVRSRGQLQNCGGETTIAACFDIPTLKMFPGSFDLIREKAHRREFWKSAEELKNAALDELVDIKESVKEFDRSSSRILEDIVPDRTTDWKSKVLDTFDLIEERYQQSNGDGILPGLSTGYKGFDERFNGLQPGKVYAISARPGCGKTTLVCNLIENVTASGGIPGLFTLEMLAEELVVKFLAKHARIDSRKLESGRLYKPDFPKLSQAVSAQATLPIHVDDRSRLTIDDIAIQTRRWVKEHGVNIIFLDYAQLVKGTGKQHEVITDTSRALKDIAKTHKIPVVVLAQMNREGNIKGSGAVEEDCDVLTLLEPSDPEAEGAVAEIKARIVKCRGGSTGTLYFNFIKQYSKFEEIN